MHTGQLKGINHGHQTDGIRLPGQRTLFHEDKEHLSRQSVKYHFFTHETMVVARPVPCAAPMPDTTL
jgi:hypothetical protein